MAVAMGKPSFTHLRDVGLLPDTLRGGVVAIGNFDGVHLGHRAVLDEALNIGRRRNIPALVLTFEPHPRTFFRPQEPVFRLTPPKMKAELLRELGFDCVVEQGFDAEFSQMAAGEFVDNLLSAKLQASHLVTGRDFHFGHRRAGTPEFLQVRATSKGMELSLVEPFCDESGEPISSTRIREALARGEIELANSLLGRHWSVRGRVIRGRQLGRQLGFPTANLALPQQTALRHGIYAVRALLAGEKVHEGVASFGRRPTFDNGAVLLETFLFGFSREIYDEEIEIVFYRFLRPEEKFDSTEDLVAQMRRDEANARAVLAESG